jgi:hypothetical protein
MFDSSGKTLNSLPSEGTYLRDSLWARVEGFGPQSEKTASACLQTDVLFPTTQDTPASHSTDRLTEFFHTLFSKKAA